MHTAATSGEKIYRLFSSVKKKEKGGGDVGGKSRTRDLIDWQLKATTTTTQVQIYTEAVTQAERKNNRQKIKTSRNYLLG